MAGPSFPDPQIERSPHACVLNKNTVPRPWGVGPSGSYRNPHSGTGRPKYYKDLSPYPGHVTAARRYIHRKPEGKKQSIMIYSQKLLPSRHVDFSSPKVTLHCEFRKAQNLEAALLEAGLHKGRTSLCIARPQGTERRGKSPQGKPSPRRGPQALALARWKVSETVGGIGRRP